MKLEYRTTDYFNETDHYVFRHHDDTEPFVSKVEFSKGYWWTVKSLNFKTTTLPCCVIKK